MKDKIEVVAFDADDTLWENEVYFQEFEHQFCDSIPTAEFRFGGSVKDRDEKPAHVWLRFEKHDAQHD